MAKVCYFLRLLLAIVCVMSLITLLNLVYIFRDFAGSVDTNF